MHRILHNDGRFYLGIVTRATSSVIPYSLRVFPLGGGVGRGLGWGEWTTFQRKEENKFCSPLMFCTCKWRCVCCWFSDENSLMTRSSVFLFFSSQVVCVFTLSLNDLRVASFNSFEYSRHRRPFKNHRYNKTMDYLSKFSCIIIIIISYYYSFCRMCFSIRLASIEILPVSHWGIRINFFLSDFLI